MQLQQRINAFTRLGTYIHSLVEGYNDTKVSEVVQRTKAHNGWFTDENIIFSLTNWSRALSSENLATWTNRYHLQGEISPKTIAIVMAGNIPLVGFHDFISILISGNKVLAKLSSNDKQLLPILAKKLIEIEPKFEEYIAFTETKLENFDAVIATGSNNTARYFDHYFGKYPHIIRKNRNSVAVLTGKESPEQMEVLANDIFRYFGLGCRNVSKIYLPKEYNMDLFFNGMYSWKQMINNDKYINNYDYNKAVYLMSDIALLDNEFMLLKEDQGFSSPISVVFFERYENEKQLQEHLEDNKQNIQCIVSDSGLKNEIPFGKAQTPQLWDYADAVDTVKFLLEL